MLYVCGKEGLPADLTIQCAACFHITANITNTISATTRPRKPCPILQTSPTPPNLVMPV